MRDNAMKWISSYMIGFALFLAISSCVSEKPKPVDDHIDSSNIWHCYVGLAGRDRSLALISKYQMGNKLDSFCFNELKSILNHLKTTGLTIDNLKKEKSPYKLVKSIRSSGYYARINSGFSAIDTVKTVTVEIPPINPRTNKENWDYPFRLVYINQIELLRLNDKGYIYNSSKSMQKKSNKKDFYILHLGNGTVHNSLGEKTNLRKK